MALLELGSGSRHEEEREPRGVVDEVRQEVHERVVGPVEVLDDKDGGTALGGAGRPLSVQDEASQDEASPGFVRSQAGQVSIRRKPTRPDCPHHVEPRPRGPADQAPRSPRGTTATPSARR